MNILRLLCTLLVFSTLQAENIEIPRIIHFLPALCNPPHVEPAVPKDFVAIPCMPKLEIGHWVYWGKEDVIRDHFQHPDDPPSETLIRVKLSMGTAQTGPESFTGEPPADTIVRRFKWGPYPIREVYIVVEGKPLRMAHVGLNAPGGPVLLFNLVPTKAEEESDKLQSPLWENFLTNTQLL